MLTARSSGVEPIITVLRSAGGDDGSEHLLRHQDAAAVGAGASRHRDEASLVTLWEDNYRVYGVRKLWKAARRAGNDVGRDQVGRLMRASGIEGGASRQAGPHHQARPGYTAASRSGEA